MKLSKKKEDAGRSISRGEGLGGFLLALLALLGQGLASEPLKRPLRIVAYGDNEGIVRRPGTDPTLHNVIHQNFLEDLKKIDQREKVDLVLHTGDFVRFDPTPDLFLESLGPLLPRFFPTTGGDGEFEQGRYYGFIKKAPHLKEIIWKRIQEDKNGFEYYYYAERHGVHILSLYNPDNYGSPFHPEHRIYNFFLKQNGHLPQARWLVKTLEKIRAADKESPIIVLSHRPVLNQTKHLTEMFERFGVSLVLSGDAHVYARGKLGKTLYLVTGIMGDLALGGCDVINDRGRRDFQTRYDPCLPEVKTLRTNFSEFLLDHYLDITVSAKQIEVKAVALRDHKVFDAAAVAIGKH
jgi:predicted MPP superfamily phosphohydrolase